MKTILLFGAGKSASTLIHYLGDAASRYGWSLIVCDANVDLAKEKTAGLTAAKAISFDVTSEALRREWIERADLVISMLPATLHALIARDCVEYGCHLLTPSYMDGGIEALRPKIEEKGLLFLSEMGLDPGIDHMSAMEIFDKIRNKNGTITSFVSHCGGLVAPESDDNPWHYKITWNPANVVAAGSRGADYLLDDQLVHLPYEKIFKQTNDLVEVPGLSPLAWYANRDSLSYIPLYGLEGVQTFLRTTLRYPAFCKGWDKLVMWGFTESSDQKEIEHCQTFLEWFNQKTQQKPEEVRKDQELDKMLRYLGVFDEEPLPAAGMSSAQILQYLLEKNLKMQTNDRDMVVMVHEVGYETNGQLRKLKSVLIVKGDNEIHTAMSKTVGLPLGIAARLILTGDIQLKGLYLPVHKEIYKPVLKELHEMAIRFQEYEGKKRRTMWLPFFSF